jgi:hypothetical protein
MKPTLQWSQVVYCHPLRFGAIWSARSACSQVMLWFFAQCGLLEQSTALHWFPHRYRRTMNRNSMYAEWHRACRIEETPFVRVIRDPCKRTVSTFSSALRRKEICRAEVSALLGREVTDQNAFSFCEFLSFLVSIDVSACNPHIREQLNPIETRVRPSHYINVDAQDLHAGLNQFEEMVGLPRSNFTSGPLRAAIDELQKHHVTRRFDPGEDYSDVRLGRFGVRNQWPSHESLLTLENRHRIERIYQRDFAAYRHLIKPCTLEPDRTPASPAARSEG